jgi:hypothetical protein
MGKKYCKFTLLTVIIGFSFLFNITGRALAQDRTQEQKTKSLMAEITDVLELKDGSKIFGRVTGSASGAVTIFNIETGEEEIIRSNTISRQRKTTIDEIKAVVNELRERGTEEKVIGILNKTEQASHGLSTKTYDDETKRADRARESLDKDLDRKHREEREDELAARARAQYLEDKKDKERPDAGLDQKRHDE